MQIDILAEPELRKYYNLRAIANNLEWPDCENYENFMGRGDVDVITNKAWHSISQLHYVYIKCTTRVTCAFFTNKTDADALAKRFSNSPLADPLPIKTSQIWYTAPA